jgi:hypothetical protein
MVRDTAWPALRRRATSLSAPVDGPPRRQHASPRAMKANDRGRRRSLDASSAPPAAMLGSATFAPMLGTWPCLQTSSATRGMARRWAARCPTSARWEASGPQSHIHISVLPDNECGMHSTRMLRHLGSWCAFVREALEYKKMQRPLPLPTAPAGASAGRAGRPQYGVGRSRWKWPCDTPRAARACVRSPDPAPGSPRPSHPDHTRQPLGAPPPDCAAPPVPPHTSDAGSAGAPG